MQSHTPDSQKKAMILGCGHSHRLVNGCRLSHPPAEFITVDINPDCKPDIVADIGQVDSLCKKIEERNDSLSAVIFEFCPLQGKTRLSEFKKLLDENGYIILLGSTIDQLDHLEIGHKIWVCQEKNKCLPRKAVIIPITPDHAAAEPNLNASVKKYLCSHLNFENEQQLSELTTPHVISERFKSVMPHFRDYIGSPISSAFIPRMASYQETILMLDEHAYLAPTKDEILAVINTYTPGFFRRNIGEGKTDDLAKLIEHLESKKDPLSNEDLIEILQLLEDRRQAGSRIISSIFVIPDKTETTRIFAAIYARVHSYLFSYNLSPEQIWNPAFQSKPN